MIIQCNKNYLLCDNCEDNGNCVSKDKVLSTSKEIKDNYRGGFTYVDSDNARKIFNENGFIQLKEIQTLADVSRIYGISKPTLIIRLKQLEEGKDYRKLGERQPILLTPKAVEKIINIKGVEL